MKLKSFTIENFRSYNEPIRIPISEFTVFVGKNDAGKSTILEALDLFFNEDQGSVKWDKGDLNIHSGSNLTKFTAVFTDLPEQIIIDSTVATTLQEEYLLNKDNDLEIIKTFSKSKPTTLVRCIHPNHPECCDLLSKKISELKSVAKKNGIELSDKSISSKIRREIWNHFGDTLLLTSQEIDVSKADAKVIADKIQEELPRFYLFRSDRNNSDSDEEVQDPLKHAVDEILHESDIQEQLADIAARVTEQLQEVSDRTLAKLQELDPAIARSLQPRIPEAKSLKWKDAFKSISISGDDDIPINKRGSGVKRLVLISFFRAEAERKAAQENSKSVIYAIEEPETSQHDNAIRMLIESFKSIVNTGVGQILLTSHNPFLLKEIDFHSIRIVNNQDENPRVRIPEPKTIAFPSINEVIFLAFDEATEAYHNELWGAIELNDLKKEFEETQRKVSYIPKGKDGKAKPEKQICLAEKIRHQYHHPDNHFNEVYTIVELVESTNDMRRFLSQKLSTKKDL